MQSENTATFFDLLITNNREGRFIKLTLSNKREKNNNLKNVLVKPVKIKSALMWQFVYRYATKDITKNFTETESLLLLQELMKQDFLKADLFTTAGNFHLTVNLNGKSAITSKPATVTEPPNTKHDKAKKRYIVSENNIYLYELGITNASGSVKSDKQDKFKQINKYVEIAEAIIKSADLPKNFTVADMGAGKGYLTFALYDYLTNQLNFKPEITGIEIREQLVDNCNKIAAKAGFQNLHFKTGSIETTELTAVDMLIALHACDIATDQAIYCGIKANAKVIICAPCCHKQIRKQIHPKNALGSITQFGILEERQAEIITDTIRALIMEAFGYQTKVFEFISTEHTPKNVMITGIKTKEQTEIKHDVLEKIKNLKALFNIEQHYLEKMMEL